MSTHIPRPTPDDIRRWVRYAPETGRFYRLTTDGRWYRAGDELTGTIDSKGYVKLGYRGRPLNAARVAVLLMTGRWPAKAVDHINGVRSDNRWVNLREATFTQNNQNRAVTPGRAGFRGVCIERKNATNPYKATITVRGKKRHLGSFATAEEAGDAYKQAAANLFGEFATDRR